MEIQDLVRREYNKGYCNESISFKQVEEIYDIREQLEVSLLPKTISLLDEEGIKRFLAANQAHFESAKHGSLTEKLIKDMEFHLTLSSLSGCFTHQQMLKNLFDRLYVKYQGSYYFYQNPAVVGDHKRIIDAVIARDVTKAQQLKSEHIKNVKDTTKAVMGIRLKDQEVLSL